MASFTPDGRHCRWASNWVWPASEPAVGRWMRKKCSLQGTASTDPAAPTLIMLMNLLALLGVRNSQEFNFRLLSNSKRKYRKKTGNHTKLHRSIRSQKSGGSKPVVSPGLGQPWLLMKFSQFPRPTILIGSNFLLLSLSVSFQEGPTAIRVKAKNGAKSSSFHTYRNV